MFRYQHSVVGIGHLEERRPSSEVSRLLMVVGLITSELHVYLANECLEFQNQQGLIFIIQLFCFLRQGPAV